MQTQTSKTEAAAPARRRSKFTTVRACAEHYLGLGKTAEEVVAACRKAFPDAQTSVGSVRWYASKLRTAH